MANNIETTIGANADRFVREIQRVIGSLQQLEAASARTGRGSIAEEAGRLLQAAGARSGVDNNLKARIDGLRLLEQQALGARKALDELRVAQQVGERLGLQGRDPSGRLTSREDRRRENAIRVAEAEQRVADLTKEIARETLAIEGGLSALESKARGVEAAYRGITEVITAQGNETERINALLSPQTVQTALQQRAQALREISLELIRQRELADQALLGELGQLGIDLASRQAAAANAESRATEKVVAARKAVNAAIQRGTQLTAQETEKFLAQARRIRDQGGPVLASRPRGATEQQVREIAAALEAEGKAERALTAAKQRRLKVEEDIAKQRARSTGAETVAELERRLAQVNDEIAQIGAGAGAPRLVAQFESLSSEMLALQRRIEAGIADERELNEALRQRVVLERELERLRLRIATPDVRALTPTEFAPATGARQLTRLQTLGVEAAQGFARRFRATLQFAISGAAIFAAQRLVREFAQAAIEVQRSFADIESAFEFDVEAARGTPKFNRQVESVRREVLLLANDFNVLPTEANEAAFQMVARFTDVNAALRATRAQLLITKIATIDQSEALRSLSAIGEAFAASQLASNAQLRGAERLLERQRIAADIYNQVLDDATNIQQRWGLAVEDTVEGVARLGATLSQLGFSLEQVEALVAAVALQQGTTGVQAAERLNRAFGQLVSDDTRTKLIEIARASSDFNLGLQDFLRPDGGAFVFDKILSQIQDLEAVDPGTVTRIFEAIGGRRELEVVSAAFRTADIQEDIRRGLDEGSDEAAKRFSFLARTIDELLKSIVTRFQELAQNLERLGFLSPLQLALEVLDKMLFVINKILQAFINVKQAVDDVGSAITLGLVDNMGNLLVNVGSVILAFRTLLGIAGAFNTQLAGLTVFGALGAGARAGAGVLAPLIGGGIGGALGRFAAGGAAAGGANALVAGTFAAQLKVAGPLLLRFAGGIGLAATAVFALRNSMDASAAIADEFGESLAEIVTTINQLRARGPLAGETDAEFELRLSRELLAQLQGQPEIGSPSSWQQILGGLLGSLQEVVGARPTAGGIPQENARVAQRNEIARASADFIGDSVAALKEGLDQFDPADAGITPEIGSRIGALIASTAFLEEDLLAAFKGGATPEELEPLTERAKEYLAALEGINEDIFEEYVAFEQTLEGVLRDVESIDLRLRVGEIAESGALKLQEAALAEALFLAELFEGTPQGEKNANAARQIQAGIVGRVTAFYDRQRESLVLITDQQTNLQEQIRINNGELADLSSRVVLDDTRIRELVIENARLEQEIVDTVLQNRTALAQSLLQTARSTEEFSVLSEDLFRRLSAQIVNLQRQGRGSEAELLTLVQKGVQRTARERETQEAIERLVQARIAQGRVNDQRAQIEADIIRIEETLRRQTLEQSERQRLLNERRRLLAQAQALLIEDYKASILLQAGVNDSIARLQATITVQARELEFLAATQDEQSAAWSNLKHAQEQAQDQLANALIELEAINLRLGSDLTNDYAQAQIDLAESIARSQTEGLGDLERAQADLAVQQAEVRKTQAFFDDRLFFLRFQFETGAVGTAAYITALEQLQANVDLTTSQGRKIFLQIKSLIDGLTSDVTDLQFNVPTSIRLPTLFEIRRSLSAEALGVDYQDNRTINVNVDASNIESLRAVLREIEDAFGVKIDQQAQSVAPGQFAFTVGGF